jgi:hypothetical protein
MKYYGNECLIMEEDAAIRYSGLSNVEILNLSRHGFIRYVERQPRGTLHRMYNRDDLRTWARTNHPEERILHE